jgi:ADP-ribose pyrophosphatase
VRDGDGVVSIEPWRVLSSRISYEDRWLKVRSDDCVTADGRHISPYHVLEYPDCINVVALTPEGQLLLVREYRHGCGEIMLGLVSGAHEAADGESADAAERAARRELREETGYSGGRFTPILTSYPNPSYPASNSLTRMRPSRCDWTISPRFSSGSGEAKQGCKRCTLPRFGLRRLRSWRANRNLRIPRP